MPAADVIRVVVADGDDAGRAAAVAALRANGCVVCGEADRADDAVAVAVEQRPDVVLLDVELPGNGITAARELARRLPQTPFVMLATTADDDDLLDSLRAGAAGYLLKSTDPGRLGHALRGVLNGEAAIPRQLVRRLTEEIRAPALPTFVKTSPAASKLTAREWQVMELLGGGLTTDQVARRLYLSRSTIRVHVSSVLKKLRVSDREGALAVLRGETP
ncbi:response regulator transcription factor [Nocardioides sp. HM23]|uniref:response regulator transcription factor n=1 Tax=Nocardioides bizhenqiangii TaxID=3095076 RepID=UPI002ACAAB4B|nr:response regulator transcription factor [Nocardioides sp. HM23]MDZ5623008.1 response regulator transcription factor [Nocardioides sp. HM23]